MSSWSSLIVLVHICDGSWRFCIDLQRRNVITHKGVHPRLESTALSTDLRSPDTSPLWTWQRCKGEYQSRKIMREKWPLLQTGLPPRSLRGKVPAYRSPGGGFESQPRCPQYDECSLQRRHSATRCLTELSVACPRIPRWSKLIFSPSLGRARCPRWFGT